MLTNSPLVISSRQLSVDYVPETHFQARLDLGLGLCFLGVALFAGFRLFKTWSSASAGRRVISVFNSLLFLASAFRAIWFLIPNDCSNWIARNKVHHFWKRDSQFSAGSLAEHPKWIVLLHCHVNKDAWLRNTIQVRTRRFGRWSTNTCWALQLHKVR